MMPRVLAAVALSDAVQVRVTLHQHGGAELLDIRRYVDRCGPDHEPVETRSGVCLPVEALDDLISALVAARTAARLSEAYAD
jgi:hypothetical protein